jgi:hypothetical protein
LRLIIRMERPAATGAFPSIDDGHIRKAEEEPPDRPEECIFNTQR